MTATTLTASPWFICPGLSAQEPNRNRHRRTHRSSLFTCVNTRNPPMSKLQNEASCSLNFVLIRTKGSNSRISKRFTSPEAVFLFKQENELLFFFNGKIQITKWKMRCLRVLGRAKGPLGSTRAAPFTPSKASPAPRKTSDTVSRNVIVADLHCSSDKGYHAPEPPAAETPARAVNPAARPTAGALSVTQRTKGTS